MTPSGIPASQVPIPEPCGVDWSTMRRDGDCRRFCGHCQHDVIDLSAMTRAQALEQLKQPGICVRYDVDADDQLVFAGASTVEPRPRTPQTGGSRRSTVKRRLAGLALVAVGLASSPALADTPQTEAVTEPSDATPLPGAVHRLLSWLGVVKDADHPTIPAEPVEPIPEVDTADTVPALHDRPERHPRMGKVAIRQPPASTQGQPVLPEVSPALPE